MKNNYHGCVRAVALLLFIVMLCACFPGIAGAYGEFDSHNGTVIADAMKPVISSEDRFTTEPKEDDIVYSEEMEGVLLYAYRSWSNDPENHRDYVSFMSDDLTNITSLWNFAGGMLSAEYYDGVLYVVDENLGFHAIDMATGDSTEIATLSCMIYDMTYDYTSGTMFGVMFSYSAGVRQLARIDLATGELTVMGNFDSDANMVCIAASRTNGVLYGISEDGKLHTVDYYGHCTEVASTEFTFMYNCSMTYSYENDHIYWQHNPGQEIVKINPETGESAVIGTMEEYTTLTGITVVPDAEDLPELVVGGSATEVIISNEFAYLVPGISKQLTANVLPFDAINKEVTWESSDSSVVTVDENGIITGVAEGEATVTVTAVDGGFQDTCSIIVQEKAVNLVGYRFYPSDTYPSDLISFNDIVPEGIKSAWNAEFEINAAEYYNGKLYSINWMTSEFVSVDVDTGEVTVIGKCDLPFTGLSYDFESDTMFGIVFNGMSQSIYAIDIETAETTEICSTRTSSFFLTFTVASDGNFYAIDDNADLYRIDDHGYIELVGSTGVSSVFGSQSMTFDYFNDCIYWAAYPSGKLMRVDYETAEVTEMGTIGEGIEVTALTIIRDDEDLPEASDNFPVTGVKVIPETYTLAPGIRNTFSALIYPWNAEDKAVTWSSSDESIATVDQNGCVVGVSAGEVLITATTNDGGFTASALVTVREDGIELRGSRVFGHGEYGDVVKIIDYELPELEHMWVPRSIIAAGEYYDGVFYGYSVDTGILYAYDPETGANSIIGACDYPIYEMAFDYTTRTMYCMILSSNEKYMARLDLETAKITITGKFDSSQQLLTLSGGRDGNFYGVDFAGDFYRIDDEGNCTFISNTGFLPNYLQSMTYDYASDSIYWAQYPDGILVKIDPETGDCTTIGTMQDVPEIGALYTICDESYLPEFISGVAADGIYLSLDEVKLDVEDTKQLGAGITPYNAENRDVVWSSANESVAIVDDNGLVTAVSVGETEIVATSVDGGFTASAKVTVVESGDAYYAYRNNGDTKYNDWVKLTDTDPGTLTSLWDAQQEIYAASYVDGYLYVSYRMAGWHGLPGLIKVDIETGEYTEVGGDYTGFQIWGMAYDYVTEMMYAIVYEEATNSVLFGTIDIENGHLEIYGYYGWDYRLQAIAGGRDGLYGLDEAGNLVKIDENGACEFVANLCVQVPFVTGFTYDFAKDKFIWTQNCWGFNQDSYLNSFDPVTGRREILGIISTGGNQPILTGIVSIPNAQDLPNAAALGDVNADGNIDVADALFALRYSMDVLMLSEEELVRADFNEDGVVDAVDALLILRHAINA